MATKAENREWNRLHDVMKSFHARFEAEFVRIYAVWCHVSLCIGGIELIEGGGA
jgi:hypothetical protein